MGNYTIFYTFESKKFYNKCFENSRSQIVFRTDVFQKLMLGASVQDLKKWVGNQTAGDFFGFIFTTAFAYSGN